MTPSFRGSSRSSSVLAVGGVIFYLANLGWIAWLPASYIFCDNGRASKIDCGERLCDVLVCSSYGLGSLHFPRIVVRYLQRFRPVFGTALASLFWNPHPRGEGSG
jgi:hypothetical protein